MKCGANYLFTRVVKLLEAKHCLFDELLGSKNDSLFFEAIVLLIRMEDISMNKKYNCLSLRRIMTLNALDKRFNEHLVTVNHLKKFLMLKPFSFKAQLELIANLIFPIR